VQTENTKKFSGGAVICKLCAANDHSKEETWEGNTTLCGPLMIWAFLLALLPFICLWMSFAETLSLKNPAMIHSASLKATNRVLDTGRDSVYKRQENFL